MARAYGMRHAAYGEAAVEGGRWGSGEHGAKEGAQAVQVEALAKETFACLHGLILAVRKEA